MIGTNRFYGVSAYVPPRDSRRAQFAEVLEQLEVAINRVRTKGEILLCADANSKSPL